METPLERICRQALEHEEYVLGHRDEFTEDEVARAELSAYQRSRLSIASTLRYDD